MKKIILYLVMAALLGGLIYGAYWYTKEHLNPSWERRAGLEVDYVTSIRKEDIKASYRYPSKTGEMKLVLAKEKTYEIFLKRQGVDYLYSKGTWEKKIDESVFPERISYLLKSDLLDGPAGEFRFRYHEMKGKFFNPQKKDAKIDYYVHFPKEGKVYETWEFRIVKENVLDVKTSKMYQLLKTQRKAKEKKKKPSKTPNNPIDNTVADHTTSDDVNTAASTNSTDKISKKERHEKANILTANLAKLKNKIVSVYDCKGCYGEMTVRLILLMGMEFEIHILEGEETFLYSKGVYGGGRTIGLNAAEIKQEYAAYRLEKHPYHGTFVNDAGGDTEMKAIRKVEEIWKAKSIFETWMFRKTDEGNMFDVNDKQTFLYNKQLSE